jgi:hypothetical protein
MIFHISPSKAAEKQSRYRSAQFNTKRSLTKKESEKTKSLILMTGSAHHKKNAPNIHEGLRRKSARDESDG